MKNKLPIPTNTTIRIIFKLLSSVEVEEAEFVVESVVDEAEEGHKLHEP